MMQYTILLSFVLILGSQAAHQIEVIQDESSGDWVINLILGNNDENNHKNNELAVIFDTGQTETIVNGERCKFCKKPGWDLGGFSINETASPAQSLNQGFATKAIVGDVAVASMGASTVLSRQLWVVAEVYNSVNASEPPPSNPYTTTDGIMGCAELPSSFCDKFNNTCEPSSLFLDLMHEADAEAFSVYFPPFKPPGAYKEAVGTLTLGPRESDFEEGPAVVVPRADEIPEIQTAIAEGNSTIINGKWWFAMDDVLVNGKSVGGCAAGSPNNTLGKCLAFTDTGSPRTSVPPELLTLEQQSAFSTWFATESMSSDVPITYCDEAWKIPLNISISVGGMLLSLTPPDMALKIGYHEGRSLCLVNIAIDSLSSGFDDPNNPAYALPAPAIFAGNNWIRNFYITHTTQSAIAPASMSLGCALNGLGKCDNIYESFLELV